MSSIRSRSVSPKRNTEVLSDEDYVKQIKHHNTVGLATYWNPGKALYVIVQDAKPNLYGEISKLYSAVPDHLNAIALTCLCTSQRDSSLLHQRQTKRIAQLLFASILFSGHKKSTYDKILPMEIKWFENLFPGEGKMKSLNWKPRMDEHTELNGYMLPVPIILRSEFCELD